MRINIENKSMDIEARDINFIIDQYAINYKFASRNTPLECIVIPMFAVAKTRYGDIPIQFVPDISNYAKELAEDGKTVVEATPEQTDEIAKEDAKMQQATKEIKKAFAESPIAREPNKDTKYEIGIGKAVGKDYSVTTRIPKQPAGPIIPPGSGGLSLSPRDPADLRHTAMDLAPEKDIDESKQKNISVSKDESGNKRLG
jgi:hypothetical protein